jgi:hypothetical protein
MAQPKVISEIETQTKIDQSKGTWSQPLNLFTEHNTEKS